jgi:tetratricopeptide (TPR) repeat protein
MKQVAWIFFLWLVIFQACHNGEKGDRKNHSLVFTAGMEHLLKDRASSNSVVDSLKMLVLSAPEDSVAIRLMLTIAENLKGKDSKPFAEEALLQSRKIQFTEGSERALFALGNAYNSMNEPAIAESLFQVSASSATLDRIKARSLSQIALINCPIGNFDKALEYFGEALTLAEKVKDTTTIGLCLVYTGQVFFAESDYVRALEYYRRALDVLKNTNQKARECYTHYNMAETYRMQNEFSESLVHYQKASDLAQKTDDSEMAMNCLAGIGGIYQELGDYPRALAFLEQSVDLGKKVKNKIPLTFSYSVIGQIVNDQGDHNRALDMYRKALAIAEEINDNRGIALALSLIGETYSELGKYDLALDNITRSQRLSEEMKDKNNVSFCMNVISQVSLQKGEIQKAIREGEKALLLAQESAIPPNVTACLELLYKAHKKAGNSDKALQLHERLTTYHDSLNNSMTARKFTIIEFQGKEAKIKAEQDKKDFLYKTDQLKKEDELKRQKVIRYAFTAGFLLLLLLVIFIYRGYKGKQRSNVQLAQKNDLIEQKQKEILDSIHYAKRIQRALLPNEKYIQQSLTRLKKKF